MEALLSEMKINRRRLRSDARRRRLTLTSEQQRFVRGVLAGVAMDTLTHAAALVKGKTDFRNILNECMRQYKQTSIAARARGEISKETADEWITMADGCRSDAAKDVAWNLFAGEMWQNTLKRVAAEMEPGTVLPPNTTPAMVLNHLEFESPQVPKKPEDVQYTVESMMNEEDHHKSWEGSARVRTGTAGEILESNKLNKGLPGVDFKIVK